MRLKYWLGVIGECCKKCRISFHFKIGAEGKKRSSNCEKRLPGWCFEITLFVSRENAGVANFCWAKKFFFVGLQRSEVLREKFCGDSSVEKKSLHCIFVLMTQNTIKFPLWSLKYTNENNPLGTIAGACQSSCQDVKGLSELKVLEGGPRKLLDTLNSPPTIASCYK